MKLRLLAMIVIVLPLAVFGARPAQAALPPLSVTGNQLLAGGQPLPLRGVNRSGTEYACIQGWGIFDGPSDTASVQAIGSWKSNVVHIGLNEDCILGINGVPAAYAGANYMTAVIDFVNTLHTNGLYAEVSLMWAAAGTQKATGHPPILDQDHAGAALQAIANAFKTDPATYFGLQSEPHDISWTCWRDGGTACSVGYAALGMQGALDAVRSTGATNPVTISGINWANDLSQWLTYKPNDALGQLVAEAHVYGNNACGAQSGGACLDSQIAPVAAQVPVFIAETGETYDESECSANNMKVILPWADAHGIGWAAWVWDTWGNCSALISNYNGTVNTTTPGAEYPQYVHDRLAQVGPTPTPTPTPTATPTPVPSPFACSLRYGGITHRGTCTRNGDGSITFR